MTYVNEEYAKDSLEAIVDEEKQEGLGTCWHCRSELLLDVIYERTFCPKCDIKFGEHELSNYIHSGQMFPISVIWDFKKLTNKQMTTVLKLRETRYNRLLCTWQEAVKGNRKAEFFVEQINGLKGKLETESIINYNLRTEIKRLEKIISGERK